MGSYFNTNGMDRGKVAWLTDFCRGRECRAYGSSPRKADILNDAFVAGYTDFKKYPLPDSSKKPLDIDLDRPFRKL
jgi:hypothetical protein